jgi:hypothetical protein
MLVHRQHAAGEQALDHRAAELADQRRIGRERAIADRRGRAGQRQIEHRHAVDRDAERLEVGGEQAGVQPGGLAPGG